MSKPNEAVECWLPVVGYEKLYEVSDLGRVRSLDRLIPYSTGYTRRHKGRILKGVPNSSGYLLVSLWRAREMKTPHIHYLVLTAFVGPRPLGMESCHGPGGLLDNRLANLRWDTKSENTLDQVRAGTHQEGSRVRCPRRHLLQPPNLPASHVAKGWRTCLACSRATAYGRLIVRRGGTFDLKELADGYYAKIMAGIAPEKRRGRPINGDRSSHVTDHSARRGTVTVSSRP